MFETLYDLVELSARIGQLVITVLVWLLAKRYWKLEDRVSELNLRLYALSDNFKNAVEAAKQEAVQRIENKSEKRPVGRPKKVTNDEWLSFKEAAFFLKTPINTFKYWLSLRKITVQSKMVAHMRFFEKESLKALRTSIIAQRHLKSKKRNK